MSSYAAGSIINGYAQPQYPPFQRMQSTRQDNNVMVQRGMSQASHALSAGWHNPHYYRRENDMRAPHRPRMPEHDEYESREIQVYADLDNMDDLSLRDSGFGGDTSPARHRTRSSVNSTAPADYPRGSFASDESAISQHKDLEKMGFPSLRTQTITRIEQPRELLMDIPPSSRKQSITTNEQPKEIRKDISVSMRKPLPKPKEQPNDPPEEVAPSMRSQSTTSSTIPTINKENELSSDSDDQASMTSRAASPAATSLSSKPASSAASRDERSETAESVYRAMSAPEVVTKEYESMLSNQQARPSTQRKSPISLTPVHPALRIP